MNPNETEMTASASDRTGMAGELHLGISNDICQPGGLRESSMKKNKQTEFPFFADEADEREDLPDFSLRKALTEFTGEITPDDFLRMAKAEMQRVFGEEPEIDPESEIPPRSEGEADFEWLIRRNLILMVRYLNSQFDSHADPERVRDDLMTIDRFLNTWLLSLDLDAEDANTDDLTDYFEEYLMTLDPVPPFPPQFGALARFYDWMMDEPDLKDQINYVDFPVPRACEDFLTGLHRKIPYLTRLYEIATDSGNDAPASKKPSKSESEAGLTSPAQRRMENWIDAQCARNQKVLSLVRQDFRKDFHFKPDDLEYAERISDTFLTNILPNALIPVEYAHYASASMLRNYSQTLMNEGRYGEVQLFTSCMNALNIILAHLGYVKPEHKGQLVDPFYSDVPKDESPEESMPDDLWRMEQAPDRYVDHLNWLKWNIDRNRRFLLAFQEDLQNSGMAPERVQDHVAHVQKIMGVLLHYEGSTMETLSKGLDRHYTADEGYFLEGEPDKLRQMVGSLRRFYRSMAKLGYLSPDVGDELLSYLKQQTHVWMKNMDTRS